MFDLRKGMFSKCSLIDNTVKSVDGESPISICAPGMNRTCDLRFRKPSLYPLSYGGFGYFISFLKQVTFLLSN